MQRYRQTLGRPVTADDVFYSVYGQLHDPAYRQAYAADLARTLPRIPTPQTTARFEQLVEAGRALAELHLNYETAEPYPLQITVAPGVDPHDRETWRVSKMKWVTRGEHTAITYNPKVRISGIPEVAERYQIGSRSAVGWLLDRYQRKVDKPSGIVNDPNDWCDEHDDPRYIITLIEKVTTVAVRTMEIVDSLPAPEKQG